MTAAEKLLFSALSLILVVTSLGLLFRVHNLLLVEVPSFGGEFTEGLIGSPRFVNPILAISDTDKDIASLIYSGLIKVGIDGSYQNDLAESFSVSEDGLIYDFTIKEEAYFHDGKPVTTNDVAFTIEKVLDQIIKSPKRANWEGVVLEKVSEKQLRFVLKKPYAPFMEALTLGILPKHIWESASSEEFPFSQWNISPIGSGPYKINSIKRNSAGIPTLLTLSAWNKYASTKPKIKNITFKFFQNESDLLKAYEAGEIESLVGLSQQSAAALATEQKLILSSLPRVFGLFLNQNAAPLFLNSEVRQALNVSAPKERIVKEVLGGFGSVLDGPLPTQNKEGFADEASALETAKNILSQAGWKSNEEGVLEKKTKSETSRLVFSISTSDAPELKRAAEMLRDSWGALGAVIEIKVFESGELNQNVIRPRKYEALLFGEVVGAESDLYPFWHSSQRNDPGLNVSLYANISADKLLEDLRTEPDREKREEKRLALSAEINKDKPAIFLFAPSLVYAPAPQIKNILLKQVGSQSERFAGINEWFIETEKVWRIFAL